jgi:hypothetical protein
VSAGLLVLWPEWKTFINYFSTSRFVVANYVDMASVRLAAGVSRSWPVMMRWVKYFKAAPKILAWFALVQKALKPLCD